jgi:hypothetical protein
MGIHEYVALKSEGVATWPKEPGKIYALGCAPADVDDLESSDYGRDLRFLPGWWILPFSAVGTVAVMGLAILFL